MRAFNFITALTAAALLTCGTLAAQDAPYYEQFRYIEVTGTSEVEIIPDEIHFVIGIKEYFKEEFDGVSKPEDYRTKVRIETIESQMRKALHSIGITDSDIRTQDVGDYWRERGLDFLIGKNLDITLHDFTMIDKIISVIDTKGVSSMRIGEMTHKDILKYQDSIKEHGGGIDSYTIVQNSKLRMDSAAYGSAEAAPAASASDAFRTIKYTYSVTCRFALKGW